MVWSFAFDWSSLPSVVVSSVVECVWVCGVDLVVVWRWWVVELCPVAMALG